MRLKLYNDGNGGKSFNIIVGSFSIKMKGKGGNVATFFMIEGLIL